MKVVVLAVGGLKGSLAEVVRDYEKRASRYWKLEVIEVSGGYQAPFLIVAAANVVVALVLIFGGDRR